MNSQEYPKSIQINASIGVDPISTALNVPYQAILNSILLGIAGFAIASITKKTHENQKSERSNALTVLLRNCHPSYLRSPIIGLTTIKTTQGLIFL